MSQHDAMYLLFWAALCVFVLGVTCPAKVPTWAKLLWVCVIVALLAPGTVYVYLLAVTG